MKPSRQSFFLLAVLTLFAGFVLTASGWKGKEAVSIAGSIGVLWFHFSAHFGERGTRWKAWTLHPEKPIAKKLTFVLFTGLKTVQP